MVRDHILEADAARLTGPVLWNAAVREEDGESLWT